MADSIPTGPDPDQQPAIQWESAPVDLSLLPNEVHVWAVRLDVHANVREDYLKLLRADERDRAGRYRFETHRDRFITGRGSLRTILGRYLETPPASLEFSYGANGKPALAGTPHPSGLHFNVAHSGGLALIAVSRILATGVDVECVRELSDFDELVGHFFSPREAAAFGLVPPAEKASAFFNLWTRKEAWLKATGEGIARWLNQVEVTFLPGAKARLLELPHESATGVRDWTLLELTPAVGFAAALAVRTPEIQVRCWEWSHPGASLTQRFDLRSSVKPPVLADSSAAPVAILGVRFDHVTIAGTLDRIETMIASRRPHYLVTANVDFVVQAQTDLELRRIFFDADLVLCDGTPLVWASALLGNPLPERVAGADLVPLLIQLAEQKSYRLFFLGAAPPSLSRAMENLRVKYPGLIIAGSYSPPFNPLLEMDHEEIHRRIVEAKPDVLLVSLGCPKQEKWVAMNYRALGVPVTIGVGATIDFLAGQVRRAPAWMQRGGLEWVFRLAQEPRRLYRRYSKDLLVFGWRLLGQWLRSHLWEGTRDTFSISQKVAGWKPAAREIAPSATVGRETIKLRGKLDLAAVGNLGSSLKRVLNPGKDCFLDLSEVSAIDSAGVATFMRLQRDLRASGHRMVLIAPSRVVAEALRWMRLDNFFDSAPEVPAGEYLLQQRAFESDHAVTLVRNEPSMTLLWHGEITAANVEEVWEKTRPYVADFEASSHTLQTATVCGPPGSDGGASVNIDLSAVRFIDSSGLGLIIRAKQAARRGGKHLELLNPQPAVRNVLRVARLESLLSGEQVGGRVAGLRLSEQTEPVSAMA